MRREGASTAELHGGLAQVKGQVLVNLLVSGKVFLLVAAVQWLELLTLAIYHRSTGRGLPLRELVPMLAAGIGLAVAAFAATSGAAPWLVAAMLLMALLAHVADLAARWHRGARR